MSLSLQRILFLLLLSLVFAKDAHAQEASFKTQIDAKQVVEGGTFTVEFVILNADPKDFSAPSFKPFKVISGPSQSYRSTFINGKGTKSVSFSYTLLATKQGKYRIEGAEANINGKLLRSNSVVLQVVKSSTVTQNGSEQIYIKAEVDTNAAYIGQQVLLRYKIYTQTNIENYNILSESSYPGCYPQALMNGHRHSIVKEVIDGVQYSTKILREIALFPQQGGKIEIEPIVVQVGIPSGKVRRGLFSSYGVERRNLTSNSLALHVKSAYDGAPPTFCGAVGQFLANISVSPPLVTTDDAISVLIQLQGDGDVKTIRPPRLQLASHFEVYEPKIKEEKMINSSDSIMGIKTIEYLVLGNEPGTYDITPSITYFDPHTTSFKILTDTFTVEIEQGSGKRKTTSTQDNDLENLEDQLAGISHDLQLRKKRDPIYIRPWYLASFAIPVLAFIVLTIRSRRNADTDVAEDPKAIAKERLQASKALMDKGEYASFFEEVSYSLKQFICHQLQIDVADLSKQKVRALLVEHKIDPQLITHTMSLLDQCDLALYAGQLDSQKVHKTYDDAVNLLTELSQL